ncbi:PaaX family transcriptional regulator C-terminal domain-containing protein [Cupriavidus alkaliphilus]|uniref:PaaX family transcriptional regulator C-terminal domain-containing protein n=1 Tax=Cupriavidus alkaliphilus TaxID=942866 RepID=UPI0016184D9D|nr:PaaX family transcriptional regulator C-terminal domain-containing protein [Cupriavidus alkaliphilus]MBB3012583.1 phenylacetic acid degradation operon negative regulatory protein [Cupriavidus alkaliphilus]
MAEPSKAALDESAPGPAARRLILKLLVASETETLDAADAIRACALFGISDNNARVALTRLASADLIEAAGRGTYRLGPEGRALGEDISAWRIAEQRVRPWDGTWIAVLIAGLGRSDRTALRARERALALVGMRQLEEGLYVRPDNLAGGVAHARERLYGLGVEDSAPVFTVRDFDTGLESKARGLWNGKEIVKGYREGKRLLEKSEAKLDTLPLELAAKESYLLGDQAIRQLVFDPMLPEPLVSVADRVAFGSQVRRYDEVGRSIWQRFLAARG